MESIEGDWEVYSEADFKGDKLTIKSGTTLIPDELNVGRAFAKDHNSFLTPKSVRPLCDYAKSESVITD